LRTNISYRPFISDAFEKQHTIDLFQNDKFSYKAIDIRIWFDEFEIYNSRIKPISIETFISNGKRGWTKLYEEGWETQSENRDKLT
jgi:hypothetical protein